MSITLWTWNTPNGRKISVALEEMGLAYAVCPVNISKGEQFNPEFLAFSPNNRIPAIQDPDGPDGKPITVFESGAILLYLAEKTGRFLPRDLRARVPVYEWLMWQMGGFGPMPGQVHHRALPASRASHLASPTVQIALLASTTRLYANWLPAHREGEGPRRERRGKS
ncbi:MAG: glutathione S-transferase family protein, partial [Alphaproteobacteria bacterium]